MSAFCNAGFALQSNSLEAGWNDPALNVTIALLIVLGGLGFLVIPEPIAFVAGGLRLVPHFPHPRSRRFARRRPRRVSVQTRISLIVTFGLILIGMAGFWMIESGHILRGRSADDAFLVSLFQSVTTRTAGFKP
ncbi:MAG: potassium transporter TrkG [Terrimicrobiaceae bacterium]